MIQQFREGTVLKMFKMPRNTGPLFHLLKFFFSRLVIALTALNLEAFRLPSCLEIEGKYI